MAYDYVLFPGRHHLLTRFQAAYLERAVAVGVPDAEGAHADCRGAQVVFAVTSADHGTTRRNPLPAHRREAQIERYAALSGMDCLVFPVADVPPTERFAEYLLAAIAVQEGPELTPENTVVACSTPAVIELFGALGFRILPVELDRTRRGRGTCSRRSSPASRRARCTPPARSCGSATGCSRRCAARTPTRCSPTRAS